MSKSLHALITAEIKRRERLKQAEKRAKLQAKIEKTEAFIWKKLDEEFAKCLASYSNYVSHEITTYDTNDYWDFPCISKELGFEVEYRSKFDGESDNLYHITIPAHTKGTKRTLAQKKLLEFEKQLRKVRKERKAQLLAECERVKQELMAKRFDYIINERMVAVPSEIKTQTPFEKEVVIKFFKKYKLRYAGSYDYGCDGNHWHFYL